MSDLGSSTSVRERRGRGASALSAANVENEIAAALSDEAKKTIASAMNELPDDVMKYVMAYTPVSDRMSSSSLVSQKT